MSDIVSGGMSDKSPLSDIVLRDRIAAVLYREDGHSDKEWAERTADAVIAELRLRPEELGEVGSTILFDDARLHRRYVTDWEVC